MLFGYTISGERTLEAFYQTVLPWAEPFMALFNREKLPSRSALSRFLAVFTLEAVEALRALFVEDLLARPLAQEQQRGELLDRAGGQWEVFDIDGTREAARQRALPKTEDLPAAQRRLRRASVRLGIPGASVGKSSVPVPSFRKPTALSGSAVSETEGMGRTARNWHTRWGSSVAISRRSACLKHVLCYDWTVSTELGPSLQIWMASAS